MSELVAFAGDWHGSTSWALSMLHSIELRGIQNVVQVGDFGLLPGSERFLDRLQERLSRSGQIVWWLPGNHDDPHVAERWPMEADGTQAVRPNIRHMPRGHRWTWDGITYLAVGGAISVNRHNLTRDFDWWPEEAISDEDVERAIAGGPVDALVSHDAPTVVPRLDEFLSRSRWTPPTDVEVDVLLNRRRLRTVVDAVKPELLVHGHYHHRYEDELPEMRVVGLDRDRSSWARNILIWNPETKEIVE